MLNHISLEGRRLSRETNERLLNKVVKYRVLFRIQNTFPILELRLLPVGCGWRTAESPGPCLNM